MVSQVNPCKDILAHKYKKNIFFPVFKLLKFIKSHFLISYFPQAGFPVRSFDQKTQLEDVYLQSPPIRENTERKQAYHCRASKNISNKH